MVVKAICGETLVDPNLTNYTERSTKGNYQDYGYNFFSDK